MTAEKIRTIEKLREISDSEWEELKSNLLAEENNKFENMKITDKRVYELLKEIGMPPHLRGYKYLKRAIMLCVEDFSYIESVTKVIYTQIAKEFSTTPYAVERSIRTGIEAVCENCNSEKFYEVFGNTCFKQKGKHENANFIAGCVEYLLNK